MHTNNLITYEDDFIQYLNDIVLFESPHLKRSTSTLNADYVLINIESKDRIIIENTNLIFSTIIKEENNNYKEKLFVCHFTTGNDTSYNIGTFTCLKFRIASLKECLELKKLINDNPGIVNKSFAIPDPLALKKLNDIIENVTKKYFILIAAKFDKNSSFNFLPSDLIDFISILYKETVRSPVEFTVTSGSKHVDSFYEEILDRRKLANFV
jgi:hypothetical protein